jgi:hypothetical protein
MDLQYASGDREKRVDVTMVKEAKTKTQKTTDEQHYTDDDFE